MFNPGQGRDEVLFPRVADPHAYALKIGGDGMEPIGRDGDIVVVSPQASIRRIGRRKRLDAYASDASVQSSGRH